MLITEQFDAIRQRGTATQAEAIALFDDLDPVDISFMIGRWRGSEFPTGHPMDGMLTATNWYGKEFVTPDVVHPLLFSDTNGDIFKVAPSAWMMRLALQVPMPQNPALTPLYTAINSLQKTDEGQARLRMMEHRDRVSATMIYDNLPIHDIFRKVDDTTVLGLMDYKAVEQPYFFVLERAAAPVGSSSR